VRRISTVYDVVGNVRSVTSFDANNSVVNEVLHEYDANDLLVRDFSNPNGAVHVASTPHIGYTYDATKSGEYFTKRLRQETMKYPSGKTLSYDYDAASNVSAIKEGNTPLVSYTYSGSGSVMQTTYNEPDISLNYDNGGVEQEILNAPALLGTILYQIRGTADGFSEGIARDDATFIANIANSEPVTITSTQAGKHYGILVSFWGRSVL